MPITTPIAQALCAALEYAPERGEEIAGLLTAPPNLSMGDFAFPCFQLAKALRAPPPKIAADLAARVNPDALIAKAVAQGPYVNLHLHRPEAARRVLGAVLTEARGEVRRNTGGGQVVVLDFSAPNIAKPFHFGHLRSTNLGADLARIFAFLGYRVVRRNYLGDWGTQFGFVIHAWQKWGDAQLLRERAIDYLVELYVRAYRESESDPGVREQARLLFLRLEQGDPEITALWRQFRELSLAGFMKTYRRLGIEFDSYEGEAAVNPLVEATIARFQRAGVAEESQGALVVQVSAVIGREIAPLMLRKSDGASTYAARDCAEALDRWERYGFSANIYVVSRQEDHFAQVFAALTRLGEAEGWDSRVARGGARRGPRPRAAHPRGEVRRQPARLPGALAGRTRRRERGRGPGGAAVFRRLRPASLRRQLRLGQRAAVRRQHRAVPAVFPCADVRHLPARRGHGHR